MSESCDRQSETKITDKNSFLFFCQIVWLKQKQNLVL